MLNPAHTPPHVGKEEIPADGQTHADLERSLRAETGETTQAVAQLVGSVMVLESLVEDILTMVAEGSPDLLERLRDTAAGTFQRIKDQGPDGPEAWTASVHHERWSLLDVVLCRVGRPYTGAEVVSLADVRRASAITNPPATETPQ
ncbi:MAG: hypothetical protein EON59_12925 [Alphaproteobacteria bacterium]|nr:MAG: hypothetical protein EON59_12925 [Alphaproteobacteria bacterium]